MKISSRTFLAIWLALLALLGGHFAYDSWIRSEFPPGLIQASGRIGGDAIPLPAGLPGRIVSLEVKAGDFVQKDQVVGVLDGSSIHAQLDNALDERDRLRARRDLLQSEWEIMKQDVPISIQIAKAALHKAEARLEQSRAVEEQRRKELERIKGRNKAGRDPDLLDQAQMSLVRARARRQTDEAEAARLVENVKLGELGYRKIDATGEEFRMLQGHLDEVEKAIALALESMGDPSIKAPIAGVVTKRLLGVGDQADQGQAVAEMADPDRLFLKVSLPHDQVAQLAVGLPARVWLEAHPEIMLTAKIGFIAEDPDPLPAMGLIPGEGNGSLGNAAAPTAGEAPSPNATGAPQPLYGVRLYFDGNPGKVAVPGQTGAAVIRYNEDVSWRKPRKPFRK